MPPSAQRELAHSVFSLFGALVLGPVSRNIPLPICNDFEEVLEKVRPRTVFILRDIRLARDYNPTAA